MTKLLVDTNVMLDLLAKRDPFYVESRKLFSLSDINKVELIISSLSIVNSHYILKERLKMKNPRFLLGKFKVLVKTFELNDKIIELALNDPDFKDFEDGIHYYTALEAKCKYIITRNLKDFQNSAIPVFSPKEYLAKLKTKK